MRHWLDSMFKSQEIYLTAPSRRVESQPPPMHFYKYLSSLSLCLQALLYLLCQPLSICLPMSHLSRYQLPIATCLPTNLCARKFPQIEPPSSISRSSSSSASKSESPSSSWWSHFDSFSAVLWCKIKVNMHLFRLAKGFPILDFKDVQSMDLVQQMEVWEVQNYLWDAQKWCHLLLIAAVAATWAAALIASLALYLDLYVVEGNLQDTDGMKVHERMPWEHFQGIIITDTTICPTYSPAMDLQILAWVIGPFWRLHTATALLVACCSPANKCVEFSWHEVAKCRRRDNSLTLQIEDSWRNGYELAANSYCCCIASDCRFRLLVFSLYYVWSSFWNDRAGWKGNSLSGNR